MCVGREREYLHREVFRRSSLFFQDVVNVFLRNSAPLRALFEKHAVKGYVLHDFVPANRVEAVFEKVGQTVPRRSLLRCFALCKCTFINLEEREFAPGLCYLEFLECVARVANERRIAASFAKAFSGKGKSSSEDGLAEAIQSLIDALTKKDSSKAVPAQQKQRTEQEKSVSQPRLDKPQDADLSDIPIPTEGPELDSPMSTTSSSKPLTKRKQQPLHGAGRPALGAGPLKKGGKSQSLVRRNRK
jgi:hypothetical protein